MRLPKFLEKPNPKLYQTGTYLVIDFEVTNLDKGSALNPNNNLLLACYYDSEYDKHEHVWGSEYDMQLLVDRIEEVDFIVAHNAKFELQWLRRAGLDLSTVLVYDTQISQYVINGNRTSPLTLDYTANRYGLGHKLKFVSILIHGGVCPSLIPKSKLLEYCKQDVMLTAKLFEEQMRILVADSLLPVLFTRCILTPVLADIEFNGVTLDEVRVRAEYGESVLKLRELESKLFKITGDTNLNSTKQLGVLLYDTLGFREPMKRGKPDRTAAGAPRTDIKTIRDLTAKGTLQKEFKELYVTRNKIADAITKYLEFFMGVCEEFDGTFYASFNQTVTQTHRLSSSGKKLYLKRFDSSKGVQFQNLPRAFKRLFKAKKEGWLVGERDAAQLEFRVAGHSGHDEQAIADIKNKVDIHSYTASVIFEQDMDWIVANKDTDKEAKRFRQEAKAHTFKPIYGGQSGTEAEQRYYKAFREKYKGITATQNKWIDTVLSTKKLVTETGLIFYWPDTEVTRSGYVTNSTNICNFPIQMLATADIIPIGVTYFWHKLKASKLNTRLVNTIHDSVVTEEPANEKDIVDSLAREAFIDDVYAYLRKVYNIDFTAPLDIDGKTTTHWGSD